MAKPEINRERTRLYENAESGATISSRPKDVPVDGFIVGAMAAAMIPSPLIDLAAISSIQLAMLAHLCKRYDVPFSEEAGKAVIGALCGGAISTSMGTGFIASLVKSVPIVGTVAGAFALPLWACATTYALAKVFKKHFESGGTLLDFSADAAREDFKRSYEEGKSAAPR